jgi:hypothetical protein
MSVTEIMPLSQTNELTDEGISNCCPHAISLRILGFPVQIHGFVIFQRHDDEVVKNTEHSTKSNAPRIPNTPARCDMEDRMREVEASRDCVGDKAPPLSDGSWTLNGKLRDHRPPETGREERDSAPATATCSVRHSMLGPLSSGQAGRLLVAVPAQISLADSPSAPHVRKTVVDLRLRRIAQSTSGGIDH